MMERKAAPADGNRKMGAEEKQHLDYTPSRRRLSHTEELKFFHDHACFHEAGHLVVLQHFGGIGYIRIGMRDNPGPDQKPFTGAVHIIDMPEAPRARRLIGLAGIAAECLFDDLELEGGDLEDWIDGGVVEMSETDAEHAEGYTFDDLEDVIELLRRKWPLVVDAASWEQDKLPGVMNDCRRESP